MPQLNRFLQPDNPKSLNVAVMGPANAGKSTWTNRFCGSRISSVSSKPQTTRERISGIFTSENMQIVLYDTPGLLSNSQGKQFVKKISFF